MLPNDEQLQISDAARQFAQERLKPFSAEWDREHRFPKEAIGAASHRLHRDLAAFALPVGLARFLTVLESWTVRIAVRTLPRPARAPVSRVVRRLSLAS